MDIRSLDGRFDALSAALAGARGEQVRRMGDTRAARQKLCAALLVQAVFPDGALQKTPSGAPYLADGPCISLSHAGDYAVLAASEAAVGVDVERVRPVDCARIAARFFHPDEAAFLQSHGALETFFTLWTLKESFIKAQGRGFSRPLSSFCVLPEGARGATVRPDAGWRFRRYDAPEGYCLSVCAAEGAFCETLAWVRAE